MQNHHRFQQKGKKNIVSSVKPVYGILSNGTREESEIIRQKLNASHLRSSPKRERNISGPKLNVTQHLRITRVLKSF